MARTIPGPRSRNGEKGTSAESRSIREIHENHQIYRDICITWGRRALCFGGARQNKDILEELRQRHWPQSLSLTYSGGLQARAIVAAAQIDEGASPSEISTLRLVQGLHTLLSVEATREEAPLFPLSPRKCHGRKAESGRAGTLEFERKPSMTCRIERVVAGEGLVILRICGQIADKDVDLLRALLERETRASVLDLKDILLVDRGAVKLLALSESNGTELRNCPAYIREWVTRERADEIASQQATEQSEDTC